MKLWSSQCAFNLNSWKSNLKKLQAWMGLEPMTLRYPCNALSTELSSHMDRWPIVSSSYTIIYTIYHLSTWLDSSVDRALHQYHKVMGSSPVQAWNFFRLPFQLFKLKAHCEDHNFTHVYPQFTYMILIYSYSYSYYSLSSSSRLKG